MIPFESIEPIKEEHDFKFLQEDDRTIPCSYWWRNTDGHSCNLTRAILGSARGSRSGVGRVKASSSDNGSTNIVYFDLIRRTSLK